MATDAFRGAHGPAPAGTGLVVRLRVHEEIPRASPGGDARGRGDGTPSHRGAAVTRLLLVAAILAGAALRFDGLDRRPLWYDEAATVLHLGGRSEEGWRAWYDGRPLGRADLVAATASVAAVVAAARADEPQSGSAYFALAALWRRLVGPSLGALRAFSALASVLAIVAVYALARGVTRDRDGALAVAALVALSPLHLRYAAEARPYALWSLALVVWLVAVRHAAARGPGAREPSDAPGAGRRAWALAGVALVVALAVHPLTLLAVPAAAALAPGRPFRVVSGIGMAVWAVFGLPEWLSGDAMGRATAWVGEPTGMIVRTRAWLGVATSVFYRPGGEGGLLGARAGSAAGAFVWVALGIGAAVLVVAGLAGPAHVPERARRFVRRLAIVPWAALAAVDLVAGGRRSTVARYLVPSWLGVELAVGGWLAAPSRARRGALAAVLLLAALSALTARRADVWWDTDPPRLRRLGAVVALADARRPAIVLSDAAPTAVVELAAALGDDVVLRLGLRAAERVGTDEWGRVVVALASEELQAASRRAAGPAWTLAAAADAGAAHVLVPAR